MTSRSSAAEALVVVAVRAPFADDCGADWAGWLLPSSETTRSGRGRKGGAGGGRRGGADRRTGGGRARARGECSEENGGRSKAGGHAGAPLPGLSTRKGRRG